MFFYNKGHDNILYSNEQFFPKKNGKIDWIRKIFSSLVKLDRFQFFALVNSLILLELQRNITKKFFLRTYF